MMRKKSKFFIGLTLVVIGVVTNVLYYYCVVVGCGISGFLAVFLIASSSIIMLFFYFAVGLYLMFYNRPCFWEVE